MPTSPALDTLLAYHAAWTGHDWPTAMSYLDPELVVLAPAGRIDGAEAFRAFMEPFSKLVIHYQRVAAFGDDAVATIVYDTDSRPVPDAPGAEVVRVRDGRIVWMRIIFDRLPFDAARQAG